MSDLTPQEEKWLAHAVIRSIEDMTPGGMPRKVPLLGVVVTSLIIGFVVFGLLIVASFVRAAP